MLVQLAHAVDQLVLRDVHRTDDVTGGVFLGRADVDDQGFLGIDQGSQLAVAQALAAATDFVDQQRDQQNNEDRHQDVVVCRKLNQVSNHLGCSTRLKMPASIHSPLLPPKPDGPAAKPSAHCQHTRAGRGNGTNIRRRWRICPKMRVFIIFEQP
ncbi:hypothetical protein D3C81_1703510 [compost metagenome]